MTLATLGAALLVRRLDKRKPYMLAGLAAGTMAAAAWNAWGGAGVPVLGAIAQPWPPFHVPSVDWRALPDLLSLAFALTIVALAQSISIAGRGGALGPAHRREPRIHGAGPVQHRRRLLLVLPVPVR